MFISIYQMTPLPFNAAVKQPHLLQCALRYYDSAANVSCDAAIVERVGTETNKSVATATHTKEVQEQQESDKLKTCEEETQQNDMRSVRTTASLLLLFCYITVILVAPLCTGQGGACSCNDTNSRCDDSGVCRCDPGWEGEQCERCVPKPGCRHGSCQQPWQCNCETGWGGRFCDKDLSMCSEKQPCRHGATCVIEDNGEYACMCPEGFLWQEL
ncbi:hypothetical protein fugu_012411 [Takifugu bimaculatus]|uniref:EGF-like domain-containing protein n=1 Tax=Takifugu bimaculatus TaxID=433685 RepID=A0A4Z2C5B5_9TELE|nr:hypothetical protein fugu_012411 [Takifugu bimaculatus]